MEIQGPDFVARRKTKSRLKLTLGTDEENFSISVLPPTKRVIDDLIKVSDMLAKADDETASSVDIEECLEFTASSMSHNAECREITPEYLAGIGFDVTDIGEYVGAYLAFMGELTREKLELPNYPYASGESGHHKYAVSTAYEKMVADYANIPIYEVDDLDFVYYLRLRRDAFIASMERTESGREVP